MADPRVSATGPYGPHESSHALAAAGPKRGEKVKLISNGTEVAGDPRGLRLEPEQVIVLRLP
ncbi:hypothetical protein FE697_010250 [Mumia zhuanghuii]|uniref:Uncharacterized protein n=1 Tax=Mumia zhuanghuii TaxID=2585211 RepID=A0A5Q6S0V4_9ACTN|nr:hypothetical protein FE697_010250 [Mumia zhuanghuii]